MKPAINNEQSTISNQQSGYDWGLGMEYGVGQGLAFG
jgi:opacity protein-like surface antigen